MASRLKRTVQGWATRLGITVLGTAADAATPTREEKKPDRGFKAFLSRLRHIVTDKEVSFLAAGVAFYGMLSLVPGVVAVLSLYGLVADPEDVRSFVEGFSSATPREVSELIRTQLEGITGAGGGGLGVGLALSLAAVIWTASGATQGLIRGVNLIHDVSETRNAIKLRLLALGLTMGLLVFVVIAIGALTVLPEIGSRTVRAFFTWGRWPVLAVGGFLALTILYHVAPAGNSRTKLGISGAGAGIAILVWLVGSAGFAFYASNFGSYNETYGALGAVIVVLLWLYISGFAILLGAAIDRAAALTYGTGGRADAATR